MKRLGIFLLSTIAVTSCGGDAQLRSEVADLRISLEAVEARQDKIEGQQQTAETSPQEAVLGDRNQELEAEIAALKQTQDELLEKINDRPKPRPARKRPDPQSVYSIELGSSPFVGAKHAKVTIVESFEFA